MIPAPVDIEIQQGDRHEIYFRAQEQIYDEANEVWIAGDYIDLTGMTIRSQIRTSYSASSPAAEFTCTVITPQSDPDIKGSGMAYLLPSQTAVLTAGDYVWDLEISSGVNFNDTWFSGKATVKPEVTR